jgi:hypothetical protein
MSTDPLSQLYIGKCHGQVSKQMYDKNMVCQYLKLGIKYNRSVGIVRSWTQTMEFSFFFLGIKYKIHKNAVLFMMVELDRGYFYLSFIPSFKY